MKQNDILAMYGNNEKAMTAALLEAGDVASMIPKGAKIGLKPNLVVSRTPEGGATTHTGIVEAIIQYLQAHGQENIIVIESSWVGDSTSRAFQVNGYPELSRKYNVPLVDVKKDKYDTHTVEGISIEMSRQVMELDYLINIPVLKGHCQTSVTCALKNMKGCISDRSKRHFHTIGLHKPIACLNKIRCADLVLVDALNGDLDFEEGGNPVPMNRMLLARDSVLLDTYGASLMGYHSGEVEYISIAARLGVGSNRLADANIVELNKDALTASPTASGKVKRLAKYIDENNACSACYANLIHALARLDERGRLSRLNGRIHIGQGFKGRKEAGVGVGSCTSGCAKSLPGCPPQGADIVEFLRDIV